MADYRLEAHVCMIEEFVAKWCHVMANRAGAFWQTANGILLVSRVSCTLVSVFWIGDNTCRL